MSRPAYSSPAEEHTAPGARSQEPASKRTTTHYQPSTRNTVGGAVTSPVPQPVDTSRGAPILSPRTLKNIRPSSHIYEVYTGEPNKSLTKHPPPPPASDPHPLTSWEPATPREHPTSKRTPSRHHPGHQLPPHLWTPQQAHRPRRRPLPSYAQQH